MFSPTTAHHVLKCVSLVAAISLLPIAHTGANAAEVNVASLPHTAPGWSHCGRRCVNYVCVSINKTVIDVRISRASSIRSIMSDGGRGRNGNRRIRGQHKLIKGPAADTTAFTECVPLGKHARAVSLKLRQDNCPPLETLSNLSDLSELDITYQSPFRPSALPTTSLTIEQGQRGGMQHNAPGCEYEGNGSAEGQSFGGTLIILPDGYAFGSSYVSVSGEKHAVFYSGSRDQALGGGLGSPMQIADHYTRIWELSVDDYSSRRR